MGIVFDLKRFAIHDGPGLRTTVFLKGCPCACRFCHNPEGRGREPVILRRGERCTRCGACVGVCPTGALSLPARGAPVADARCIGCGACAEACVFDATEVAGRQMSVAEVMEVVSRDIVFYDESGGGATFSGGEPLCQPEFLCALLEACRERGIHTAVDTSGYADAETFARASRRADLMLFDIKVVDAARHEAFAGVRNETILANLRQRSAGGGAMLVRLPLFPGVNDDEENVKATGALVASLPRRHGVDILPYHGLGVHKYERLGLPYSDAGLAPPAAERVSEVARALAGFGLEVSIRGDAWPPADESPDAL